MKAEFPCPSATPPCDMADHEASVELARALGGIGASPEYAGHRERMRQVGMAASMLAIGLAVSACASYGQGARYGDHPNGYGVDFYEPFDNSRDYGPSFLVGPPNRAALFPNDEGARSSGRTLKLAPPADATPSIPTAQPNRDDQQPPAVAPPSPVQ